MAKAKNLAILAGLAGLAYANRDTLFGKKKTYNEDAGDQKTSSYTGDTKKVAASDDRMSNEDYIKSRMKKAPEDEKGSAQSDVLKAVTATKEAPNDKAGNQGVIPPKSSGKSAAKAVAPSGMTDAQNNALANAGKKSKATAENNALAKVNRGMDREVTEAAKANAAPASSTSKVADTVKTVAKTVAQGPLGAVATATKPLADKATNAMRETYRDLSGKVQYKTPDIPSAAKTVSDAVASGAKKVGSGIADYANRTFTLEGRERAKKEADDARAKAASPREYDEDVLSKGSAMRRGGMTKMASGGMTVSRRGDGIAQRGKTRGKMC